MNARIPLEGSRFGRLAVIEKVSVNGKETFYKCICDCGQAKTVRSVSLRNGDTQSCGCLRQEKMADKQIKHGLYRSPSYNSWRAMLARCKSTKHRQFKDYGGRGIQVCQDWQRSFESFISAMGERPKGTSLDRIDTNGNYEPSNCRWSTTAEQNRNKRFSNHTKEST